MFTDDTACVASDINFNNLVSHVKAEL
jgi:hypothetical protein